MNPAVSVTTSSLPGGQVGGTYASSVSASGGTTPYSWSVTVGALPAGVALNSTTGALSGTPTTTGTANFTVTATDGLAQKASKALSITVIPSVSVTSTSLPGGQVGVHPGADHRAGAGLDRRGNHSVAAFVPVVRGNQRSAKDARRHGRMDVVQQPRRRMGRWHVRRRGGRFQRRRR